MLRGKRFFILILIVLVSIISVFYYFNSCNSVCEANNLRAETQNFSHIVAGEFKAQLPGATIVDVRTPEEYVTGHIAGAVLINLYANDFKARIGQLDRNIPYYIYCRSGNRSHDVVDIMKTAGFKKVYGLTGGINEWTVAGFNIE